MVLVQKFYCFQLRVAVFVASAIDLALTIIGLCVCGLILTRTDTFMKYVYEKNKKKIISKIQENIFIWSK